MNILTMKTVLVAEDDDFTRRVLAAVLYRLGGRIVECADGERALDELNQPGRIDLALLDVFMPKMHGVYVLQQIRAGLTCQDFEMPVMLVTASSEEAVVHYASKLSCDGFLLKPVNHSGLSERLGKIITRHMSLPYKPAHYRKVDVGPPDQPLQMPVQQTEDLTISQLRVGMVFSAPVMAKGRVIIPKGKIVTDELLTVLRDLDKKVVVDLMSVEPMDQD